MKKETIEPAESVDLGFEDRESLCLPTEAELEEVRRAVSTLVGKWKLDILFVLLASPKRFGELRRALPGITQHMLTTQLRSLEADRFVIRTIYAEVPPRVEYALAPAAHTLKPVFLSLVEWSRHWHVQGQQAEPAEPFSL